MRFALSLFLLLAAQPALSASVVPVAASAPHQRVLALQGGRNFRDLGGYRTADGRMVKWGVLFRSGSMHGLTQADYAKLEAIGIRTVCDFRDRRERASEPAVWPTVGAPTVLSDDYDLDMRFFPKGDPKGWTAEQTRAAMAQSYPRLLDQFKSQYRRMFGELLAGHAPLAFNCTAGKDRTGIAAALLLTALGVPRQTVIEDYLRTNRTLDTAALAKGSAPNPANPMTAMSPEAMKPLMAADQSYIAAVFTVLDGHTGGAEGWLRDELGLSHADLIKLRLVYLTKS